MQPNEIADHLCRNAESVCQYLLPDGVRAGSEWKIGSLAGEKGQSLSINLKSGVWKDFSTNEKGGDLLDLWAKVNGQSISEAMRDCCDWLGIKQERLERIVPKLYTKPKGIVTKPTDGPVMDFLKSRGISEEAVKAYRLKASERGEIAFPYIRNDELINVKYLGLARPKGKKEIRQEAGCERILFGWQAIPTDARTVTICEGELDALSLWQYKRPALSVPDGAGNHGWIENEWEHLERFDEIFICFDSDQPGQDGMRDLVSRLGSARCRVVALPKKDANECLQAGISQEVIDECFQKSTTQDPEELHRAGDYLDELLNEFGLQGIQETGIKTPWNWLDDKLRFRSSELIVVNGINGHGKSQLVGQLILHAAKQGHKSCIFSGEMKPRKLLKRLAIQAGCVKSPTLQWATAISDWMNDRIWLFELVGGAKQDRLLEVFRYARKRYGITVFVIDSLLKCGIGDDDYNGQKLFVEKLCDFKNETNSIVFLVTHSRKGENEDKVMPGKFDVRGAGAIVDLCDSALMIWRNKIVEEAIKRGEKTEKSPVMMRCVKQRNGDWEGYQGLYYDMDTYRFKDSEKAPIRPYVPQLKEIKDAA